jgi:hypothetical protein
MEQKWWKNTTLVYCQVIWNWYDINPVLDLHPNQTFSKLPQQNCSFIFSPFLSELEFLKVYGGEEPSRNRVFVPARQAT